MWLPYPYASGLFHWPRRQWNMPEWYGQYVSIPTKHNTVRFQDIFLVMCSIPCMANQGSLWSMRDDIILTSSLIGWVLTRNNPCKPEYFEYGPNFQSMINNSRLISFIIYNIYDYIICICTIFSCVCILHRCHIQRKYKRNAYHCVKIAKHAINLCYTKLVIFWSVKVCIRYIE